MLGWPEERLMAQVRSLARASQEPRSASIVVLCGKLLINSMVAK